MNIRIKLSIQFTTIVASILLVFTTGIYFFSLNYRENDFHKRLKDRASTTARLFLDVKEVDEPLLKIIDKNTLALSQERIYVVDNQGKQIYCNVENSFFNNAFILDEIKADKEVDFKDGERDAVGILYRFNENDYCIIVSAYDIYGIAKINNLRIILIVGFVFCLLFTVLAGLIFSGRALAPISDVIGKAKRITISNLNLRIDEGNRKDEIAQLAMTFNQMLHRLEEAFILQRDFVANAAHELRTPFTVMLAEVEYSLMHERTIEQYKHVLENLTAEIKEMSNLSNGLLELARMSIDDNYFERKNVRIDELLVETCDEILRGNFSFNIKLIIEELPEDETSLLVKGNAQLLKIAIRNLIENGCKFSDGKLVKVFLTVEDSIIMVKVQDKGIGISNDDRNHIFQPFFRGRNTQFIAGYGLGLALTKKVVELHSGEIRVESKLGEGSIFTVLIPVSIKSKF